MVFRLETTYTSSTRDLTKAYPRLAGTAARDKQIELGIWNATL